ncbi:LysR family transcriptional regulator [Paraburkholderia acidisoli]|uniref:LysR family transcriptional regulator n=1 Tax=Paraburkholderia acidisoli TaxID=2571748 RepID=A0A7Z2GKU8_9BURK|nr:LysR family transcriptional regulator [Paraburkholderia acidisoli]QGZ63389.1 LysR family transcriptional regulator [Paraburkholderia acidisoli]
MTYFGTTEGTRVRVDLTDMRLILSIIEHGSFTQGARAMNLALASVSERVARIEGDLGAPLFERSRRGVQTTAAGDALARHARLILRQVEELHGDLHMYAQGLRGRVRLLANTASLTSYLPPRLRRFLCACPDLSVDLEERPSIEIVEALLDERAELGVVADTTDLFALQTRLVAEDRLVVVMSAAHPFAQRQRVSFPELLDEPFVGLADGALEVHLAERAARLGRQIPYRIKLRNLAEVGMMIEAGVGITVLSEAGVAQLRQSGLSVVALDAPWAARCLYLCARDFRALTPAAARLAEHLDLLRSDDEA